MRRASILIPLLLAVPCFDIATGLEHWPFGSYPMYSLTYGKRLAWLRVYGVTGAGEIPLRGDRNFAPFDESRLVGALGRVSNSELPDALRNLLRLHNRNSDAPIRALRLYSVSWALDAGVRGDEPPETRLLVAEVSGDR